MVIIYAYLCVYIVMGNYLSSYFNKMCKTVNIYFYCMLKVRKKD